MAGKVFISCGQRAEEEKGIAKKVRKLLQDEFGLTTYLSFRIQSLKDIMTITKELSSSDYYLFIDFLRESNRAEDLPCSLFTHQELALAHHLGFDRIIALQQKDAPREGFLRYVLSNPESFNDENDLLDKVRALVRERDGKPEYSRNLVVTELHLLDPIYYADHTGSFFERVWQVKVENRRPDIAAVGSVCILDYILTENGNLIVPFDRSYLKWAGQSGYERTILPKDFACIDVFAIHADRPGLFLHSLRDTPRKPILQNDGNYKLSFKLFSQGFPLLEFCIRIELRWRPPNTASWPQESTATLVTQNQCKT
ncbi:MAG: hypothetical protein NTX52_11515 [Planctomycetota bacterium]|nr:hypothetical protein [Planctomycetota bacterium]